MRLTLLPGGVQTFDIKRIGSRVALGRKEGSDIIINEPVVSGTHCYITVTSNHGAYIEDVSTNGTYVNGVKIGKGSHLDVHDGDMLTLGKPGTNTGPIGSGVCVNFRVSFEPQSAEQTVVPVMSTASMSYKQEIEDLKVLVSQGEHRNDILTVKNSEISSKMVMMDNELKKVREDNIELTVRNDSMKSEIESLRLRLNQADNRADSAEKRSETLQSRILTLERDTAEISRLRAEFNFTHSLREEMERLRRRNNDLSSQLAAASEARRKLLGGIESIQKLAGTALRSADDDNSSVGTVMSPQVVRKGDRNYRGVATAYIDHPVEAAIPLPDRDEPIRETPTLAIEDSPRAHPPTDLLSGTQ